MSLITHLDIDELVMKLTGVPEDDYEYAEDALIEKFGVDTHQLVDLMNELMPMLDVGISPLTGKTYVGFSDEAQGMWLLKKEWDKMPDLAVQWLTDGQEVPEKGGFKREITRAGKVEFEISIKRPQPTVKNIE